MKQLEIAKANSESIWPANADEDEAEIDADADDEAKDGAAATCCLWQWDEREISLPHEVEIISN